MVDDGAGEAETAGYLDYSDMPPWDTWVAYVERAGTESYNYLLSWVPDAFVKSVDGGIFMNAYGALYWLSDGEDEHLRSIREALRVDGLIR